MALNLVLVAAAYLQSGQLGGLYDERAGLAYSFADARHAGTELLLIANRIVEPQGGWQNPADLPALRSAVDRLDVALMGLNARAAHDGARAQAVWYDPPHALGQGLDTLRTLAAADPNATREAAPYRSYAAAIAAQYHSAIAPAIDALWAAKSAGLEGRQGLIRLAMVLTLLSAASLLALQWYLCYRPIGGVLRANAQALAEAEARVEEANRMDPLTRLPRRKPVLQEIDAAAVPGGGLGLVMIDLVRFSEINDLFGEEIGDAVLVLVADEIRTLARPSEIAGRIGTNAFLLASTTRSDPVALQDLAQVLTARLSQRREIRGHSIVLSPAIALTCREGINLSSGAEALLSNCELAMQDAKKGPGIVHFSTELRAAVQARRRLVSDLRRAMEREEIEPFFQPQVSAQTGALLGFEALARWRHPERGLLGPYAFLEMSERANLSGELNRIMVSKSLKALLEWRELGYDVPQISLNFAPSEMRAPGFVDQLLFDVDRAGLTPGDVAAELLETALIKGPDDPIIATALALKQAGFRLDLDDFGTGFASLSTLQLLPVDRVKIDRAFVRDLNIREDRRQIAEAMIRLAETLGIEALAEGVESQEELQLLVGLGCHALQGFGIGRPMPDHAVPGWIDAFAARVAEGRVVAA